MHGLKIVTLTTCLAASSAGNPRQDFAAMSDGSASQIPSEAIISLPPTLDSFNRRRNLEVKQIENDKPYRRGENGMSN